MQALVCLPTSIAFLIWVLAWRRYSFYCLILYMRRVKWLKDHPANPKSNTENARFKRHVKATLKYALPSVQLKLLFLIALPHGLVTAFIIAFVLASPSNRNLFDYSVTYLLIISYPLAAGGLLSYCAGLYAYQLKDRSCRTVINKTWLIACVGVALFECAVPAMFNNEYLISILVFAIPLLIAVFDQVLADILHLSKHNVWANQDTANSLLRPAEPDGERHGSRRAGHGV
jgi:hypothetical protein